MADPRAARSGASGVSPRLGAADPRARSNAQSALSDQAVDKKTLEVRNGQLRLKAADDLRPIEPTGATISTLVAAYNTLLGRLKGL